MGKSQDIPYTLKYGYVVPDPGNFGFIEGRWRVFLEGHGVSRSIMGRIGVTIWVLWVITLLTKSPWPSK